MSVRDGIEMLVRPRDLDITVGTRTLPDERFDDGNLHIIDDRSVRMPNVLNANVAYFWRFWHLDPRGVNGFSSIGARSYDPSEMPIERARTFYDRMRERYAARRRSRYGQPDQAKDFPQGAVSVFYQGHIPKNSGITRFTDLDMLKTVIDQAGDRPIIVKPHPLVPDPELNHQTLTLARADKRLIVTDANVHDILAASAATVSINSTVALEGFLHRVPAILFGQSDFHHFTGNLKQPEEFGALLARELERKEGYEQFFAWYFLKNCLSLNSGKVEDRIWEIFAAAGFPRDRFAVTAAPE